METPTLSTWYIARTYNDRLATATLRRVGVQISYPRLQGRPSRRRPKPQAVPLNPGYVLLHLQDVTKIELAFSETKRLVPWQVLTDIPGISYLFHDGENLLPLLLPPAWMMEDRVLSAEELETLLGLEISYISESQESPASRNLLGQESPASRNLLGQESPASWIPTEGDQVTVRVGALADWPARLERAASGDLIASYQLFGRQCSTTLADCSDVRLAS